MVIGFLRGRYKFDLRNFAPPSKIFFKNGLTQQDLFVLFIMYACGLMKCTSADNLIVILCEIF